MTRFDTPRRPRRPRYRCRGVGLALTIASLTLLLTGAESASAGNYVMRSCNVPGERPASAAPWQWQNLPPNVFANDECGSGGGFGLNAGPMQRSVPAAVVLIRPSQGPQTAISIRRVRLWLIARLSGTGSALFVAISSGGATGEMFQDVFGPPGGSTLTTPYVSPTLYADTTIFHVVLACSGSTSEGCNPSSLNPLEIRGAEVTLNEDVPPSGTVEGGSLFSGRAQTGTQAVAYEVRDQESGVAQVSVLLGSTVVATEDFGPECPHSDFAACPTSRAGSIAVDTRRVPDGSHAVALRVTDAAGNRETIPAAGTINIANGTGHGLGPNGIGATSDARLTAAFVRRGGSTATIPYSGSATVRGRLTSSSGQPIVRAKIEVIETPALARTRSTQRVAVTRSDGRFSYALRRRGMSRSLRLLYRPYLGTSGVAALRRLRVKVSASGSLQVSLRGVRVLYHGRVWPRPIPRGGKLVYIEGRAVGGAWTRFAVKRTTRSGRFSGRYRLRVRRPGVRLQFRLRIPGETGYPYGATVGRAVTRTVR